jgi:hypothetical protein
MVLQRIYSIYSRLSNIFFLSNLLKNASKITVILLMIFAVFFLIVYIFPSLFCFDCQNTLAGCSIEYSKAISLKDISLCDQVKTKNPYWEYENYCREKCKSDIAIKDSDPEECNLIPLLKNGSQALPSLRDQCFMQIAKNLNQSSLCNKTESKWAREECSKA